MVRAVADGLAGVPAASRSHNHGDRRI